MLRSRSFFGATKCLLACVLGMYVLLPAFAAPEPSQASDEKKAKPEPGDKPARPIGVGPVLDFPLKRNAESSADPKDEKGWKDSGFIGTGKVRLDKDTVYLDEGNDLTGITWTGPLLRMNFEITLDAMRVSGDDFFCGLTFPYAKDPCSLIVGGWGGTCVGISSLDYEDAYNNETARFITFDKNHWYHIRLRATEKRIQAWIDDKDVVDVSTEGRTIGIRWEVDRSVPLGVASWRTGSAVKNIQMRALTEVEIHAAKTEKKADTKK